MPPPALVADSPAMQRVLAQAWQIARASRDARASSVLISGPAGAGKRALAHALHERARGDHRACVMIEPAAIHADELEARLLGHVRPLPRGASFRVPGAFDAAGGGSVLLADVDALPPELVVKLVRVLELAAAEPRGRRPAHLIATTRDPAALPRELVDALAKDGHLRLPPLDERPGDLAPLLAAFGVTLPPALLARLAAVRLPDNVAQLRRFAGAVTGGVPPDAALAELELAVEIAAAPDDDAPRLVLGDLLAARGDPRGALIQLHYQLERDDLSPPERLRLTRAERALVREHGLDDAAGLGVACAGTSRHPATATLRRGFVECVRAPVVGLPHLARLLSAAPTLTHLRPAATEARAPTRPRGFASPALAI